MSCGCGEPHSRDEPLDQRSEVREHGEHATVVVRGRRQPELREDARDVLLDGAERDEQALRDRLVGAALGHQPEHLALAGGQLVERVVGALAPDELAHDGRIERRAAVRDAAHGRAELLEVGDPVLEEVADALGARLEQRHRVAGLDVLREEQDADVGMPLADLARCDEPLVGVRRRHADVDHGDVRLVHRDVAQEVLRGAGLRHDLEARLLEKPRDPLAEEDRVVREDDAPRVTELRDGAAERREIPREPVGEHLVDALRVREPLQPVGLEVMRLDVGDERGRRRREEDLAAVARGGDARGADHVEPGVPLLAEMRDAGVQAHSHLDDETVGPGVVADPLLARHRRLQRRLHLAEHGRELVTGRVDLGAAGRGDLRAQELADVRDHARVRAADGLDEPRRAFDVGEQERDGAGRQRLHAGESTAPRNARLARTAMRILPYSGSARCARGMLARSLVPPPGGLAIASRPSSDSTRSSSPRRPVPRVGSAPPTPSSVTWTTISCPSSDSKISTRASVACAYFATLASDSAAT